MPTKKKAINKPAVKTHTMSKDFEPHLNILREQIRLLASTADMLAKRIGEIAVVVSELAVKTGQKEVLAGTNIEPWEYNPQFNRKYKNNG